LAEQFIDLLTSPSALFEAASYSVVLSQLGGRMFPMKSLGFLILSPFGTSNPTTKLNNSFMSMNVYELNNEILKNQLNFFVHPIDIKLFLSRCSQKCGSY
jgi:hypothetical protein